MYAQAESAPSKELAQKHPLPLYFQVHLIGQTMSRDHPQLKGRLEKDVHHSTLLPSIKSRVCYEKGKRELGYWVEI